MEKELETITEFYDLVRIFSILYGMLVLSYSLAETITFSSAIRIILGAGMIGVGFKPTIVRPLFRKGRHKDVQ